MMKALLQSLSKIRFDIAIAAIAMAGTVVGTYYAYKSYEISAEGRGAQKGASKNSDKPSNVAAATTAPGSTKTANPDLRSRLITGAIKATGKEVLIGGQAWYTASVAITLENTSGAGFEAAIRSGETSIGACLGNESQSSGLLLYNPPVLTSNPRMDMFVRDNFNTTGRYFPAGAKIGVTVVMNGCPPSNFAGLRTTDVAISLSIRAEDTTFTVPLSISDVPVRAGSFR
jgi:hypothetical protein